MNKNTTSHARNVHHFPEGKNLETMVSNAMDVLIAAGIVYPEGYKNMLVAKYKKQGISYPRILQRIGNPNVRKHFRYQEILQASGTLLDYGCGTGDDIRALMNDGYPREKITGYDINSRSIDLGFDLYLDRECLNNRFVVSRKFPFTPGSFEIVYSGSVIHAIGDRKAIAKYLAKASTVLNPGGILFGSTLGRDDAHPDDPEHHLYLLTRPEFQEMLAAAGFNDIDIRPEVQEHDEHLRFWFWATKA